MKSDMYCVYLACSYTVCTVNTVAIDTSKLLVSIILKVAKYFQLNNLLSCFHVIDFLKKIFRGFKFPLCDFCP